MAEIDVWLVELDAPADWLPPTPGEADRAARLISVPLRQRYLRSHAALRTILGKYTTAPLDFVLGEHGKPYLAAAPQVHFNLSHSHERALVAVAWEVEIGADIEHLKPLAGCMSIAERFFPPREAAVLAEVPLAGRETEFFRRWTRIEAMLKALGTGLYGIGAELDGDWTVLPVEAGPEYVASVAANRSGMSARVRKFEG